MNLVKRGQVWSMSDEMDRRTRVWFTVISVDVEQKLVMVRWERGATRKGKLMSISTMRRGMRGCRIEVEANGEVAPQRMLPAKRLPKINAVERSTASDHRKVTAPRGLTAKEREAWISATPGHSVARST